MGSRKAWILGAALCGALLCGPKSQAGTIDFVATGTFASSGTPEYINGPAAVVYTGLLSSATYPPVDYGVSLGTFTTSSSSTSLTLVSDDFTLTVTNINTTDTITFSGTLSGAISATSSTAFILFSSPLSQTLDGYVFTISANDASPVVVSAATAGRLNLIAPTTNGGVSSLTATVSSVPEPASIALLGLAVPALAGLACRRVRR
jgi:hypothetical protein